VLALQDLRSLSGQSRQAENGKQIP
jgi:hypothetical protein